MVDRFVGKAVGCSARGDAGVPLICAHVIDSHELPRTVSKARQRVQCRPVGASVNPGGRLRRLQSTQWVERLPLQVLSEFNVVMNSAQRNTLDSQTPDIASRIPDASDVYGVFGLSDREQQIWDRAKDFLKVRSNDAHSLYAYGIARQLTQLIPEARTEIVLPAILLHDTGWSQVPEELILSAIAPGGGRPDLVRDHEVAGARIAKDILTEVGCDAADVEEIASIIDGHDSRTTALSVNDALVKDADKIWRLTPHGVSTVMGWFGLDHGQAHRLCGYRVHDHLFTVQGRTMAAGFAGLASMEDAPALHALT